MSRVSRTNVTQWPAYTISSSPLEGDWNMQRNASAHWSGGLKDGKGTLTSPSGVLKNTPYSFATRFESQPGTNPEELVAAAHAGCFSMALSAQLGAAGMTRSEEHTSELQSLRHLV